MHPGLAVGPLPCPALCVCALSPNRSSLPFASRCRCATWALPSQSCSTPGPTGGCARRAAWSASCWPPSTWRLAAGVGGCVCVCGGGGGGGAPSVWWALLQATALGALLSGTASGGAAWGHCYGGAASGGHRALLPGRRRTCTLAATCRSRRPTLLAPPTPLPSLLQRPRRLPAAGRVGAAAHAVLPELRGAAVRLRVGGGESRPARVQAPHHLRPRWVLPPLLPLPPPPLLLVLKRSPALTWPGARCVC